MEYTPSKYYRQVKKIKSLLREHHSNEVVDYCLSYLYQPVDSELKRLEKHPWLVLLVIKWACLETSVIQYRKIKLTGPALDRILQATHKLGSLVRMPTDYHHYKLFFRNISYQQFMYQRLFSLPKYARQSLLYGSLDEKHTLKKWFERKHKISCNDFISLSFVLLAYFARKDKHTISINWFGKCIDHFGIDVINAFLNCISVDVSQLKNKISVYNQSKGGYHEFYEQTPFLKFPLIRTDDRFVCVYPEVLFRALESFISDSLKGEDPEKFADCFSPVFERYLEESIKYSGVKFKKEDEIKPHIPDGVKCVDFLFQEEGSNIFVDAKAVEMPYLGMVSHDPNVILGKVKTSALKAVEQALSLNNYMFSNMINNMSLFKENNYLLVVTTKELYLGNGVSFYESIAKEKINKMYEGTVIEAHIDLERIYFITVDDFEMMSEAVRNKGFTFSEIIEKAAKDDLNNKTQKFDFSQHVQNIVGRDSVPAYLLDESNRLIHQFECILN